MVGSTLAIRSKMVSPSTMQLSSLSRRSLTTRPNLRSALPVRSALARQSRRAYADAAPSQPKKKGFRFLRWTWRLTWLTGIALSGTLAYSIYDLRHPIEQVEPDPSKKTLVILGRS